MADKRVKEDREKKHNSEIKQHFNFLSSTPPHAGNFTSAATVSSCSVMDEEGGEVVGVQAESKRKDEQNENSGEDLDTSFDSEVKFRKNICCKFSNSYIPQ